MKNKKLAIVLLAIMMVFTMAMSVACTPIGDDPDFSNMSSISSGTQSESSTEPDPDEPIAELLEAIPESSLKMTVNTETTSAESSWFIVYGEDALEVKVYVVDSVIYGDGGIFASDSIEVRVAKVQDNDGYSAGAISILADVAGELLVKNLATNEELTETGITSTVTEFTFTNETIDGYYVDLVIPYSATEVSKDAKDAAVVIGLSNAVDFSEIQGQYEGSYGANETKVNTWMAVKDSNVYAKNEYLLKPIDVLFLGDSYIDKAFWNTENTYDKIMAANGINAVNGGVGGTKVEYWSIDSRVAEYSLVYNPTAVVLHIGVNDINDSHQSAAEVAGELADLYETYHVAFPNAQLYWAGLIPNAMFAENNATYLEVNNSMKAWAEEREWFTYIDLWSAFNAGTDADPQPKTAMFLINEGLHLNVEYGYPTWSNLILKALGYAERAHGEVLGDNVAANLYHSVGWTLDTENNQAENVGLWEKAVWYNGFGPAEDVYFEADFKAPGLTGPDAYPKAGFMLRGDNVAVFAYFDLVNPSSGDVCIVYRTTGVNAAGDTVMLDWNWGAQAPAASTGANVNADYVKVAIAKLNERVYMFVNGKVVTSMTVPGLTAETKVVPGVMGFNYQMLVKNATATNVESEVEYTLLDEHTVSVGEYENTTVEFNRTTAKKGDLVSFTINAAAPIEEVKVNGTVVTAEAGVYSFTMPDANVTVTIAFRGLLSVDLSQVADKVEANTLTPYEGATVTFTESETAHIVKLFANGVEIIPVEGVYSVVANENLVITGEFFNKYNGVVLDGAVDEAYGETQAVAEYNDNRSITLKAVKVERGVVLHVVAVMNTTRTDAPEWWNNTNFEFRLNSGGQRFLSINGDRNGVTDWIWKTAQEGGKYVYTVEVFVENSSISTWSASEEVQVNYAWKTGGETGWTVANYTNFWSYRDRWAGDWMASHLGGLDLGGNDFANGLDKHGVWADNLMITENGIRVGEDPSWTEVDGIVTEYEGLEKVVKEDANKTLTVTGKAADDGMYVAITVNHKARSPYFDANGDWWRNDNLEFNICGVAGAQNIVMICNGQLRHSAFWDRAAMVTSGEEGNYTTTIELYAAGVSKSYKFFVGVNGDGFNGWLCLDTDMYITPEGLVANSPVYAADVTLDGKLDDAAWTAERLAKSYRTIANGAEVTMVGFSGNYGVHLAFTIKHNRPLNEHCQGDGTQWWNYMGPEVRLGGFHYNQITCGAWNNYTQFCQFGYTNVANNGGEWAYTTVYEMFVPYYEFNGGGHRTSLVVGGVFENGFTRLWNATDWTQNNNDHTTHYVTAEGIVVSEQ